MIKFSDHKDVAVADTSAEAILDKVVQWVNKLADNKLFQDTAESPEFQLNDYVPEDDPGKEVNARIQRKLAEKPELSYSELQDIILKEDPKLATLYAATL